MSGGDGHDAFSSCTRDGAAFGGLSAGALPAGLFVSNDGGTFTDGAQRFAFDTTSSTLYYDADGSGAVAARVALAHLENAAILTSADIHIV